MKPKIEAMGNLLAAEADYLRANGWIPNVVRPAEKDRPARIAWHHPTPNPQGLKSQDEAVRIQKVIDEWEKHTS